MVKIASRPIIGKPFEYIFSIDFNGNVKDKNVKEFTVECWRPDSITREKLQTMLNYDVTRISINPQTMNDETLEKINLKCFKTVCWFCFGNSFFFFKKLK